MATVDWCPQLSGRRATAAPRRAHPARPRSRRVEERASPPATHAPPRPRARRDSYLGCPLPTAPEQDVWSSPPLSLLLAFPRVLTPLSARAPPPARASSKPAGRKSPHPHLSSRSATAPAPVVPSRRGSAQSHPGPCTSPSPRPAPRPPSSAGETAPGRRGQAGRRAAGRGSIMRRLGGYRPPAPRRRGFTCWAGGGGRSEAVGSGLRPFKAQKLERGVRPAVSHWRGGLPLSGSPGTPRRGEVGRAAAPEGTRVQGRRVGAARVVGGTSRAPWLVLGGHSETSVP